MKRVHAGKHARQEQINKLARALCDETDAIALEIGLAKPHELTPWHRLSPQEQTTYIKIAERIYKRLVFNSASGIIVVMDKTN